MLAAILQGPREKMRTSFYSIMTSLAFASTLVASAARAQGAQPNREQLIRNKTSKRVSVTIALVDSLPFRGAPAVILRRAMARPHDRIVLPRTSATGDQLLAAVFQLLAIRERMGDTSRADKVFRVTAAKGPSVWDQRERRTADRLVARLKSRPSEPIVGIGSGSEAEIYLPSKATRSNRGTNRSIPRE